MSEKTPVQEWFQQLQGTMDALLRTLGEVIAAHPQRDRILASLTIENPSPEPDETPTAQLLAEAEGIRSVLAYEQVARARAAILKADEGKKH